MYTAEHGHVEVDEQGENERKRYLKQNLEDVLLASESAYQPELPDDQEHVDYESGCAQRQWGVEREDVVDA